MFSTTAHDHLYSTWSLPLWVAMAGVLLCLVAGALAAIQSERGPRIWVLPLVLAPLVGVVVILLGLVLPFAGAEAGKVEYLEAAGPYPWWTFRRLILAELAAWAATVGAVVVAVCARCFLGGPWRQPAHLPPVVLALLGLLLGLVGPAHATMLLAWGPLPVIDVEQGARIHIGHQLELEPTITGTLHPERCELRPLLAAPTEWGPQYLDARAHCGLFGVEQQVRIEAGEDLDFYRLEDLADADDATAKDPDEPPWQPCSFGLFPRNDCRCLLEPHDVAAVPGPTLCHRPAGAGDDLRALGSALLATITIGLVIVDPDQDPRWVLVGSEPAATPPGAAQD